MDIKPRKLPDGKWLVDTGRLMTPRIRRRFPSEQAALIFIRDVSGRRSDIDIIEAVKEYLRASEMTKAATTIRSYVSRLNRFADWAISHKVTSPSQIDRESVYRFREYYQQNAPFPHGHYRRRRNGKPTKANWEKYRQVISSFLRWCIDRGYANENPAKSKEFRVRIEQRPPEIFTKKELGQLWKYFDGTAELTGTIYRLLAYTGMRLGELIRLRWRDVDLDNGVIRIAKSKSGKVRSIPIHADLLPRLKSLPSINKEYIFDRGDNEPLYSDSWYWKTLRDACREIGIRHRPVHAFRHTFAAHLIMAGVDIVTVRDLLGHADISTTMIYLHFSPRHRADAVARLELG